MAAESGSRPDSRESSYRSLHADRIVGKIEVLERRIRERFPHAGLAEVCAELHSVAAETEEASRWIARPNIPLRLGVGLIIAAIIAVLLESPLSFPLPDRVFAFTEFVQVLEAGLNALVLVGAAIAFLVTVEVRIKRARALRALSTLRALAHVIDMHQLTKDPNRIVIPGDRTSSSPQESMTAFDLTRYLDYCSEMLSLVGKVAALYAQNLNDSVVLAAVNEIEGLSTGLSRKIWQKIMIINLYERGGGGGHEALISAGG